MVKNGQNLAENWIFLEVQFSPILSPILVKIWPKMKKNEQKNDQKWTKVGKNLKINGLKFTKNGLKFCHNKIWQKKYTKISSKTSGTILLTLSCLGVKIVPFSSASKLSLKTSISAKLFESFCANGTLFCDEEVGVKCRNRGEFRFEKLPRSDRRTFRFFELPFSKFSSTFIGDSITRETLRPARFRLGENFDKELRETSSSSEELPEPKSKESGFLGGENKSTLDALNWDSSTEQNT